MAAIEEGRLCMDTGFVAEDAPEHSGGVPAVPRLALPTGGDP